MTEVVRVASAYGVPGTAALLVHDSNGRYLLSNHHVVFGGGAVIGDIVWAIPDDDVLSPTPARLGRAARGTLGRVTFGGEIIYVDCALIALDDPLPDWINAAIAPIAATAAAERGLPVHKHGGATGTTRGRVIDTAFSDRPHFEGKPHKAPKQILVESIDPALNFSASGDSGAPVLDEKARVVGLLWGCNAAGHGVATPIAAVLDCLGVELGA